MSKTILRINASSLVLSRCTLSWYRTIVQGYKPPHKPAKVVYGIASHKFIDVSCRSGGRIDLARDAALKSFRVPKISNAKMAHLEDENHFIGQCYNTWQNHIQTDQTFDLLSINRKCWWCRGNGVDDVDVEVGKSPVVTYCKYCEGTGERQEPATEVTFSIKYFEDENFIVYLEGTIDKIGQIRKGCFALGDYKFTSVWDKDSYLSSYEMAAPLRFYALSLKLMAEKYPDSMLGKIGATRVGAFIEGIFLKPKVTEITYERSDVFQYTDDDLGMFVTTLDNAIRRLMDSILSNSWHLKEGILNGTCDNKNKFGKCDYYIPCRAGKPEIEKVILARDFIQKPYDPLHHQD